MRVFLAGASGVIGRRLIRSLNSSGAEVFGLTSSSDNARTIERLEASPVVCDVYDSTQLTQSITDISPDVIVNELTRIPDRIDPRNVGEDLAETNRLRTEGTSNLLHAARHAGVGRFVSQSIAFGYRPNESEADPAAENRQFVRPIDTGFASVTDAVKECERLTHIDENIDGLVLRYGFFYGPDTPYERGGAIAEDIDARNWPILGKGRGRFSFIHVDDAADATFRAIEEKLSGTFNVVDDKPTEVREWLPAVARALDAPPPRKIPGWLGRFFAGEYASYLMEKQPGASNSAIKNALGWTPEYPDWRTGFSDLYGTELQ